MGIDLRKLEAYANWLVKFLGDDVSRLGDSGVPLRNSASVPLNSRSHQPPQEQSRSDGEIDSLVTPSLRNTSVALMTLLDNWANQTRSQRHPLLIVAPFGTGKSAALASFSIRLAEQLLGDLQTGKNGFLRVPIPVRLRALLEFSAESDKQPFLHFMHRSQLVLDPETDCTLDWETFEELSRREMLVPLFDGFDELPEALIRCPM